MGLLGSPEMIIFFKIFPIFPNFETSFRQNRDREKSGKIGLGPPHYFILIFTYLAFRLAACVNNAKFNNQQLVW